MRLPTYMSRSVRIGRLSIWALALSLVLALAPPGAGRITPPGATLKLIVQATDAATARAAVERSGGRVTLDLPIVNGVAAEVVAGDFATLVEQPGVTAISPNSQVTLAGASAEKKCSEYKNRAKRKKCRERKRLEGLRIQRVVRADELWAEGITGKGVRVAVLDTGIYGDHPDLRDSEGESRVVHCEDFSNEFVGPAPLPTPTASPTIPVPTASPLPIPSGSPSIPVVRQLEGAPISDEGCSDPFGHGTFMAGLVAGDGTSSSGRYSGSAPDADLIGIKVAGFDGSTDISKVIAGIQWATAFKDVHQIRVLNLSLGSDSAQQYQLSPLNFAVERAWQSGLVVVVSAGNSGPDAKTVMKPGDDPFVITVGSSNDEGTVRVSDDRVPVFSSRGPTRSNELVKPDLVSPGVHTISLRSPGSAIDQKFSDSRVANEYFRGTGTSMSTATVSGIVALILQDEPLLKPDQVKHRLMSTTRMIGDTDATLAGTGLVDAYAAVHDDGLEAANQNIDPSTGLGSLGADRPSVTFGGEAEDDDTVQVVTPAGQVTIAGEFVAMLPKEINPLDPAALVPWVLSDPSNPEEWAASTWKQKEWAASKWKASTWKATTWDASTWKGTDWANADWDASTWKGVDWDASTWKASTWKSAWYAVAWD